MGRKLAIAAAVAAGLAVLALVATPVVSGWYAADRLRAELDRLSAMNPAWQWEVKRYDQGLFTSRAVVRQRLAGTPAQGGVPQIGFPWHLEVHHGPTVGNLNRVRVTATPRLPGQARQVSGSLFQGEPPLTATYRIGLLGDRHVALRSPAVDGGGRMPFTWKGLEATADLGKRAGQVAFAADMPALRAGLGPNQVSLQGFAATGDLRRVRPYVWVGHSQVGLDSFRVQSVNADTGARFSLDVAGLDLESDSHAEDGLLHSRAEWRVASVFSNTTPYRELRARWATRNVDAEALQRLNELLWNMEPVADGEQAAARLRQRLAEVPIKRFLAAEPELTLEELTVTTRAGKLAGNGELHFVPAPEGARVAPAALGRFARGELSLAMPESAFRKVVGNFTRIHARNIVARTDRFQPDDLDWMAETLANHRIHELRRAGLVDAAEGRVTTTARWDGRHLTVNGQPVADLKAVLGSTPALRGNGR